MRRKFLSRSLVLSFLALTPALAQPNSWVSLANYPPSGVSLCMLLTDGGVMCQSEAAWYKLTPDANGSYLNGTWSSLASLPAGYAPDAFASAVMADGRVVVVGGEYNFASFVLTNMGAIYDPKTDSWQMITPPASSAFQCMGDLPSLVLPDGRLLVGAKLSQSLAVLDPATLKWTILNESGKNDPSNTEEGWILLRDGSIFTLDVANAPAAERLMLSGINGTWVSAGTTLQDLHTPSTAGSLQAPGCPTYVPPGEMGPAVLRPDGTVFAIGASGFTGIYTPPPGGSTSPGTWAAGPAMPQGLNVEDGPAALLPSGHVLFGGSPGDDGTGLQYFEFDGTNLLAVPAPAAASADATFITQLLVLPTGQILFVDGSQLVQIYNPSASPSYNPAWAPAVNSVSTTISNSTTYPITGTQFNGFSQGTGYGDESQNATNYPLVRITNNISGHVFYARTHDHSTMGVATGTASVSTSFDVPAYIEAGDSTLQVVANGIPSAPLAVNVLTPNPIPLTITGAPLSGAQLNVPFSAALTAAGGTKPYNWQIISGALPGGLGFNTQTGQISGTPSSPANSILKFQVTDSSTPTTQTATVTLTFAVSVPLTITTLSLPGGRLNVFYSATLAALGGTQPYTWQLVSGVLPTGLGFNTQTGQLSGTPTATASSTLKFTVTDSSQPAPQSITVSLNLTVTPSALNILTTGLPNGQANIPYAASVIASGGTTPYNWQLISGTFPPGLGLNAKTGQISGTPTSAATSALTFQVTDASAPAQNRTVSLNLSVVPPPLTIMTTSLPTGAVNAPYSATLSGSGGLMPYTWSSRRLPPGLLLNSLTGQISGTPLSIGITGLTFTVTDASTPTAQSVSVNFSLAVTAAGITILTTSLPNGQLNVPYSATLAATGGTSPYNWQMISGALPTGLGLNAQTGQISGTPTSTISGAFLGFKVTDSSTPITQSASVSLSLTVTGSAVTILTTSLPNGQLNVPYSATLTATGGASPYNWQMISGALPTGLGLNAQTGQISGTPTSAITGAFLGFKVTDSSTPTTQSATVSLSLTVTGSAVTILTTSLPNGQLNVPYSATLTASGGTSPYNWQMTSGTLPMGLGFNAQTGQISGTPTSAITGAFLGFKVTDSSTPAMQSSSASLTLTINATPISLTVTTTSLPVAQANVSYSALLAAVGGLTPYTWSSRRLPPGLFLNPQSGQITGTPLGGAGSTGLSFTVTDSSSPVAQTAAVNLNFSMNAGPSLLTITTASLPNGQVNLPYSATLVASGGAPPYNWQLMSGTMPAGLGLNAQTGQLSGAPTATAASLLTFRVSDASVPTVQTTTVNLSLSVTGATTPPPSITTSSLPSGQVNVPYSTALGVSGGVPPYNWRLTTGALPLGLGLNALTGQITGTPTSVGFSSVTLQVTDSSVPIARTASANLSVNIAGTLVATPSTLGITTTALPTAQVGVAYSATLTAVGGVTPYTWSSRRLPPGLTLNPQTGQISGTPASSANTAIVATVTDSSAPTPVTVNVNLSLTVNATAPNGVN